MVLLENTKISVAVDTEMYMSWCNFYGIMSREERNDNNDNNDTPQIFIINDIKLLEIMNEVEI